MLFFFKLNVMIRGIIKLVLEFKAHTLWFLVKHFVTVFSVMYKLSVSELKKKKKFGCKVSLTKLVDSYYDQFYIMVVFFFSFLD